MFCGGALKPGSVTVDLDIVTMLVNHQISWLYVVQMGCMTPAHTHTLCGSQREPNHLLSLHTMVHLYGQSVCV
jgi:hypothetical protein